MDREGQRCDFRERVRENLSEETTFEQRPQWKEREEEKEEEEGEKEISGEGASQALGMGPWGRTVSGVVEKPL